MTEFDAKRPIQNINVELFTELEVARTVPFVLDEDFDALFLEPGDSAHVLAVLNRIEADGRNVEFFRECRDFLVPGLSSESPEETIQHLRKLAEARSSGLSEIKRLREAAGTPEWLREFADAEVRRIIGGT